MRRLLAVVAGTLALLGGTFALLLAVNARDDAELTGTGVVRDGPGRLEPDRGAGHGADAPPAARLPTSGAHRPLTPARDARVLDGDRILHALELGSVVVAYGTSEPPPELRELQRSVAGPFDPRLVAAGAAVVLARVRGLDGVAALAWRRSLRTGDPADSRLREFAEAWLGTGAPR